MNRLVLIWIMENKVADKTPSFLSASVWSGIEKQTIFASFQSKGTFGKT